MNTPDPRADRELAALTAAWLGMAQPVHLASLALSLGALLVLALDHRALPVMLVWALVLAAGVVEWVYAARCRFDAAIFARWADDGAPEAALSAFDTALAQLRQPPQPPPQPPQPPQPPEGAAAPRGLDSRAQGARGLLRRQLACVLVQASAAAAALVLPWILLARG